MKSIIKYVKSNYILGFENFIFYLIISGIETICLLLLILRHGYNIFSPSKVPVNQTTPIYVYVIISIAAIMFFVIYIYIMRKLSTKKSFYGILKTLFPLYLLFIFILLIGIFYSESNLMHSKAWIYLALLIWIGCYIVTEVMITIFKEKIFPSWNTISPKDKYSILIPIITFILGYILN
ncbi:FAM174 family membrane protein [Enterococcus mundtii]|uniref:FAM174 family membrane protein n=1 Tax=Enterococcus TaxID=1350 RepID=UPI001CCB5D05|nr:FAM174 family membrane protein [Enterococcus mundtii]UBM06628.1 FAM174 family membrane protein [Enterococcus mundtii]